MSFILYAILGGLLALAGVGVVDQPLYFCLIMGIVIAIDVLARHG